VNFDLRYFPLTVKVEDYRDGFDTPEALKCFEESRSKGT